MDLATFAILFGILAQILSVVVGGTIFLTKLKATQESGATVVTTAVADLRAEVKTLSQSHNESGKELAKVSNDLGHLVRQVERMLNLESRVNSVEQTVRGIVDVRREYEDNWRPSVEARLASYLEAITELRVRLGPAQRE